MSELYGIYENILILLEKYRKINLKHEKLNQKDFLINISKGYLLIEGNKNNRNYIITLFTPETDYVSKTAKFELLLKHIMFVKTGKKSEIKTEIKIDNTDYIFVSKSALSNNISKKLVNIKKIYKNVYIEKHIYSKFRIEIPKHSSVCLHEIADDEEIEIMEDEFKLDRHHFPKILLSDPAIVWLGARIGDVVRITDISESTGYKYVYRIVRA